MMSTHSLNFANQDLRSRSFNGLDLSGADFSGSDIRGCDFSNTLLRGANFKDVRAGQHLGKFSLLLLLGVFVAISAINAISQMIFGVLDKTPEDPAWGYTYPLFFTLGIAGGSSAILSSINNATFRLRRVISIISASASGALLGFFYGGTITGEKDPQHAIAGVLVLAILMVTINLYFPRVWALTIITVVGSIAAYGFGFLAGARAFEFLSTKNLFLGLFWIALCLGAIALTMISLAFAAKEISSAFTTSFRGADLTNASFDGAILGNSDFSDAIGYWC